VGSGLDVDRNQRRVAIKESLDEPEAFGDEYAVSSASGAVVEQRPQPLHLSIARTQWARRCGTH
jgi:hypothetical protein